MSIGVNVKMPAEWEAHDKTLMEFPVFWKSGNLNAARECYALVAKAIAAFEPVQMIVNPGEESDVAQRLLGQSSVEFVELPHDDAWARDNAPTFVHSISDGVNFGSIIAVNWQFNAWGGKYPKWELDNAVPRGYCEPRNIPVLDAPLVLEGGSIHTNGNGLLLTTAECLLNPNRNPNLSQAELEVYLRRYTGAESVIWLPYGVVDDETDGHVDNVCCFVNADTVLLHWSDDERRAANLSALQHADLRVVQMPAPRGVELPAASYVNFYLANGAVIAPAFGVPSDKDAAACLREMFPNRELVQLPTTEILRGGGNIHCITQQIIRN